MLKLIATTNTNTNNNNNTNTTTNNTMSVVTQVQLNTVDGRPLPFNNTKFHQGPCPDQFICRNQGIPSKLAYSENQVRMCCIPNGFGREDTESTAAEDKGVDKRTGNHWDSYPMYRGIDRDWARDHYHQGDMAPFQGQVAVNASGFGEFQIDLPHEAEQQHNHSPGEFDGWVLYFAVFGKDISCVTGDNTGAIVVAKEMANKHVTLMIKGPPSTVGFVWFSRRVRWAKPGMDTPVPGPWGFEISYAKLVE